MRFEEFKYVRKGVIVGLLIMLLYIIWPFIDVLAYSCAFAYMALPVYNILRKNLIKPYQQVWQLAYISFQL